MELRVGVGRQDRFLKLMHQRYIPVGPVPLDVAVHAQPTHSLALNRGHDIRSLRRAVVRARSETAVRSDNTRRHEHVTPFYSADSRSATANASTNTLTSRSVIGVERQPKRVGGSTTPFPTSDRCSATRRARSAAVSTVLR